MAHPDNTGGQEVVAPSAIAALGETAASPENRARLAVEVTGAVAAVVGADRVGLRISPAHNIQGATEDDPADVEATYTALVQGIAPLGLVYLSVLAQPLLDEDAADAVAVGRLFLANPDLPARWRRGAELNRPNPATFYGGGAEGYTDYPALSA